MLGQIQNSLDYHPLYEKINATVQSYSENFELTYNNKQNALIAQLQKKATRLKVQIAQLKKLTSSETIQALIIKKKQDKQNERAKLQLNWREITQKLKKLQEEQKRLVNENAQFQFDIINLKSKISQLSHQNQNLKNHLLNINRIRTNTAFITEMHKQVYISPYKAMPVKKQTIQKSEVRNKDLSRKIQQIKAIQKIKNQDLIQFLGRRQIKQKIYELLK